MKTPVISIIIPVFNVENDLARCLQSIQQQSYKEIEVILVDDGSTDCSAGICKLFEKNDSRFRFFSKTNGGLSDARNFGISKSRGSLITFVDSDDYVDSDYVGYLYRLLSKNHVSMSVCQHRTIFANERYEENVYSGEEVLTSESALERLLYGNGVDTSAWAKMYQRSIFDKIHFPVGKLFEDIATTYKCIINAERIAVGSKVQYNYVYRSKSIVNGVFSLKKLDLIEMTNQMGADVISYFPSLSRAVTRRKIYAEISTLNQMNGISNYGDIRKRLIKSIRRNGWTVLIDSRAPKRDKIGLLLIYINYSIYAYLWKLYLKIKKGI